MPLTELQNKIKQEKLDAYIVTRNNQFLGQDILPEENRLQKLTGFSGSSGTLLVFKNKAILFVDGRYEIQAQNETDNSSVEVIVTNGSTLATWLQNNISTKMTIGYNPWCHPINEVDYWKRSLKNINFIEDTNNLSGALLSSAEYNIFEHSLEFTGISMEEKIATLTGFIKENNLSAFLICSCDAVSWLLNLRSDCLPDTPIVRAFALVNAKGEVSLFTNDFSVLEQELKQYSGKTIGTTFSQTPRAILNIMKSQKIWLENLNNPIALKKAIKNPVEIDNIKKAHLRDGAAVSKFLFWLEKNWKSKTELDIVEALYNFRKKGDNFYSNSFETIAGFGPNGAIVHYQPTKETNLELHSNSLLLLDSGAQYYDGTTDITRTIAIGNPTQDMITDFTQVLKSHISLASAYFPEGTNGFALDTLARAPLWKNGKTYAHGTGHGVGFFLNVHEGPQNISQRNAQTPLMENMVVSIEPGFYRKDLYGIRIENLVQVVKVIGDFDTTMFKFETLTLVPIDKHLIDKNILSPEEINWVNNYHDIVYSKLSPLMEKDELKWLEKACSPL